MESYLDNPKARFDYEVLERYDAGIELLGFEVKSVRAGRGSIAGTHIIVRGGEVFIVGMRIDPYQVGNTTTDYAPDHTRKLLLTKKEIHELEETESKKGLTLVPLSLYNKGGKIKVSFAVARGKKQFDKRETIKKRDTDRDLRRLLKR
ncbi:MAG: SsrA-binding protein SmpB [bacterium]